MRYISCNPGFRKITPKSYFVPILNQFWANKDDDVPYKRNLSKNLVLNLLTKETGERFLGELHNSCFLGETSLETFSVTLPLQKPKQQHFPSSFVTKNWFWVSAKTWHRGSVHHWSDWQSLRVKNERKLETNHSACLTQKKKNCQYRVAVEQVSSQEF